MDDYTGTRFPRSSPHFVFSHYLCLLPTVNDVYLLSLQLEIFDVPLFWRKQSKELGYVTTGGFSVNVFLSKKKHSVLQ